MSERKGSMGKHIVSVLMFVALLIGASTLTLHVQPVEASPGIMIYIRADGSIDPSGVPIRSDDNVTYTFTADLLNASIVVQRNSTIINGNGYMLQGQGGGRGIDLSGRTNVTVRNARIKAFRFGLYLASSSNNTVSENVIANNYEGIDLRGYSKYNSISGNNITTNDWTGIFLGASSSNSISGNHVTNNVDGIWLGAGSSYNSVTGNNITLNSEAGVELYSCTRNTISGNYASNNYFGIELDDSSSNMISGNYVTNNYDGIVPGDSNFNTISGNNVTTNFHSGIWLCIYCIGNTISGNNVTNNALGIELSSSSRNFVSTDHVKNNGAGIVLESSSDKNSVTRNRLENNTHGIRVYSSSNNTIYHNNFLNNSQQVYNDTHSVNVWNNGVEGNYWSDYRNRYPNATETDESGVWNTSYVIDENNRDNYPLMNQFIAGDYNHDGIVNQIDADLVSAAWQSTTDELHYNPHADFNLDGIINISDAAIIGVNWQKHV